MGKDLLHGNFVIYKANSQRTEDESISRVTEDKSATIMLINPVIRFQSKMP